MNKETVRALQTLGVDPTIVEQGKTFKKSGKHYEGAWYLDTKKGHMLFHTFCDGKLTLKTGELMKHIFA